MPGLIAREDEHRKRWTNSNLSWKHQVCWFWIFWNKHHWIINERQNFKNQSQKSINVLIKQRVWFSENWKKVIYYTWLILVAQNLLPLTSLICKFSSQCSEYSDCQHGCQLASILLVIFLSAWGMTTTVCCEQKCETTPFPNFHGPVGCSNWFQS